MFFLASPSFHALNSALAKGSISCPPERSYTRHNQLSARSALRRAQLAFQHGALVGKDNVGSVDNTPTQGRKTSIRRRRNRCWPRLDPVRGTGYGKIRER